MLYGATKPTALFPEPPAFFLRTLREDGQFDWVWQRRGGIGRVGHSGDGHNAAAPRNSRSYPSLHLQKEPKP